MLRKENLGRGDWQCSSLYYGQPSSFHVTGVSIVERKAWGSVGEGSGMGGRGQGKRC